MENLLSGRESVSMTGGEVGQGAMQQLSKGSGSASEVTVVSEGDSDHNPRVEVVSENGTISRIVVTCSCGKCTELQCNY